MRKKKKHLHILDHVRSAFAYMKEHPHKPHVKRVNAILENLVSFQERMSRHMRHGATVREIQKTHLRLREAQKAFRRYKWCREISCFMDDGEPYVVTFPARRLKENLAGGPLPRGDEPASALDGADWEYNTLAVLLFLAERNPEYFIRIRRCAICPSWMISRKGDHRFCSGKCRQYEYDNDPQRKEQHRANMRRLYRTEKERAAAAKRAVQLGTKRGARHKDRKSGAEK